MTAEKAWPSRRHRARSRTAEVTSIGTYIKICERWHQYVVCTRKKRHSRTSADMHASRFLRQFLSLIPTKPSAQNPSTVRQLRKKLRFAGMSTRRPTPTPTTSSVATDSRVVCRVETSPKDPLHDEARWCLARVHPSRDEHHILAVELQGSTP